MIPAWMFLASTLGPAILNLLSGSGNSDNSEEPVKEKDPLDPVLKGYLAKALMGRANAMGGFGMPGGVDPSGMGDWTAQFMKMLNNQWPKTVNSLYGNRSGTGNGTQPNTWV
jgi:hypothetical protein